MGQKTFEGNSLVIPGHFFFTYRKSGLSKEASLLASLGIAGSLLVRPFSSVELCS